MPIGLSVVAHRVGPRRAASHLVLWGWGALALSWAGVGLEALVFLTLLLVFLTTTLDPRAALAPGLLSLAGAAAFLLGGDGFWAEKLAVYAAGFLAMGVLAAGRGAVLARWGLKALVLPLGWSVGGFSLLEVFLFLLSVGVPLLLLDAYLLVLLGWRLEARNLALALGAELLVVALFAPPRPWPVLEFRSRPWELLGAALVFGTVALYGLSTAWPSLFPVSLSPEAVQQYRLADHLYREGTLWAGGALAELPPGAGLLTAALAHLWGLTPIHLMHPLAALMLATTAVLVYAIITELLADSQTHRMAAVLAVVLMFLSHGYFVGQFTVEFHFSRVLAGVWVAALAYWLVKYARNYQVRYLWPLGGAAGALALSYPPWLSALALALFVLLRARRVPALAGGAAVVVPALAVLALGFLRQPAPPLWWLGAGEVAALGVFLGAALAGLAIAWGVGRVAEIRPGLCRPTVLVPAMLFFSAASVAAGSLPAPTPRPAAPLSPALYEVARQAYAFIGDSPVALVADQAATAFWLHQGLLRRSSPPPAPVSYEQWYRDGQQPELALVAHLPRRSLEPEVLVLYKTGCSALLRKGGRLNAELALPSTEAQHPLRFVLGEDMRLLGYDLEGRFEPGQKARLALYFQILRPTYDHYLVSAHLLDPEGRDWGWVDGELSAPGQAVRLSRGQIVRYEGELPIKLEAPSGLYPIEVAVYLVPSRERLLARGVGTSSPQRILLGPIKILRPGDVAGAATRLPGQPIGAGLGGQVSLRAYEVPIKSVAAGGNWLVPVVLYWEPQRKLARDYSVFVHLLDAQGRVVAQDDSYPLEGRYPTTAWEEGEVVRDAHWLRISEELPPGEYRLEVGMYLLSTMERLPILGPGGELRGDAIGLPDRIMLVG